MKISVADEKKRVEEQRRILEENIADFQVHEKTFPFPKHRLLKKKKICRGARHSLRLSAWAAGAATTPSLWASWARRSDEKCSPEEKGEREGEEAGSRAP